MMRAVAINAVCPWSGDPVSPDSLTNYRGFDVGFCNPGCRDKFKTATDAFDASIAVKSEEPTIGLFKRFARYNHWFNGKLLDAVRKLSPTDYRRDMGAFFGSVETTINHIMVWDIVWLKRIAQSLGDVDTLAPLDVLSMPTSDDQILYARRSEFAERRHEIDEAITGFANSLTLQMLDQRVRYRRQSGARFEHSLDEVLQHMFNHQTHHRGQITTLLSQSSIDPGVTDLVAMLIDETKEEI